jgi:hypothetical protein
MWTRALGQIEYPSAPPVLIPGLNFYTAAYFDRLEVAPGHDMALEPTALLAVRASFEGGMRSDDVFTLRTLPAGTTAHYTSRLIQVEGPTAHGDSLVLALVRGSQPTTVTWELRRASEPVASGTLHVVCARHTECSVDLAVPTPPE